MKEILHNRYVLYSIFFIAFINFLYFGYIQDMTSVAIFILVGLLVTFFNKNMIIVLSLAILVSNVLKYGIKQNVMEGFEDDPLTISDDEEESDDDDDDDDDEEENKKDDKKNKRNPIKRSSKTNEKVVDIDIEKKDELIQNPETVFASVENENDQEKMIAAHEQLLKRMNKYKPLLDTLQGLTKNIAIVKGLTHSATKAKEELKEDK